MSGVFMNGQFDLGLFSLGYFGHGLCSFWCESVREIIAILFVNAFLLWLPDGIVQVHVQGDEVTLPDK